ncbi:MAG: ferrous iron transport protein A [Elusimicrobia bacterium]|nr:ferrous iron transport protein A [Elusimicrobiota bacterium]
MGEPTLRPLDRLREGDKARVDHLLCPDCPDAQRLQSMGLLPGAELTLEHRRPVVVVAVGENTIAMEPAVAAGIIVRMPAVNL